ncbi:MAG: HAD family hydrolase [Candidatus Dactylopiibacterium carminicum]|nr:MAG: HAD family hydrolase [Candidatus Dactylopiibacterium carminicum]
MPQTINTVIFDLGNVLIPWDPRWLFRQLLPDEAAIDRFLTEVDFYAWNLQHDAGQPFAVGIAQASARHPHYSHLFQAYFDRWDDTVAEAFPESVACLHALKAAGLRVLALTNFSAETFARARRRYAFLAEFEGIVVSGEEGLIKPDPALYQCLSPATQSTPPQPCSSTTAQPMSPPRASSICAPFT